MGAITTLILFFLVVTIPPLFTPFPSYCICPFYFVLIVQSLHLVHLINCYRLMLRLAPLLLITGSYLLNLDPLRQPFVTIYWILAFVLKL